MQRLWALTVRLLLLLTVSILMFNAVVLGLTFQVYGVIALVGIVYGMTRRRRQASGAYGTGRLARPQEIAGMCRDRGLILGRIGIMSRPSKADGIRALVSSRASSQWAVRLFLAAFLGARRPDGFIRINDFVNLSTFAPAGGGKSVSTLVPNLLAYEGNCVVVDPKGELYRLTAKHRRKAFGHKIVRIDPALLMGAGADRFNPFDWIEPRSREFISQCRDLANMIVVRTGQEHDPHFNDSAENVIAAFIAYVCALEGNPAARNLRGMRTQLASRPNYEAGLEVMRKHQGFYGVLEQLSQSLSWHVDREQGSVLSTAQRHTKVFDEPLVDDCTSYSTFDPCELRTGRMTVYLIVPGDRLVVWAALLRVILGCLLRITTRGVPTERNPLLFLVDECAHIGRMQALEDAFTLLRGSGIRIWVFFQSIEQLKKCFGDNAGTVLDNIATQQYYSINSYETAEAISKRIGDETIMIRTDSGNSGVSAPIGGDGKSAGSRSSGTSYNSSEIARRVLKPEEILVLPEHTAIVFHKNHYAIICNKIKYYADRAFRERGLIFHRFGTGRTRGLGLGEMLLALALLASSLVVTQIVADLRLQRPHAVDAPRAYSGTGTNPVVNFDH